MARYMSDDPFMQAAASLVEDVRLKAAEERGEVTHLEPGVYLVGEGDGEFEYVGTRDYVEDELTGLVTQAYNDALESIALDDEWINFEYDED